MKSPVPSRLRVSPEDWVALRTTRGNGASRVCPTYLRLRSWSVPPPRGGLGSDSSTGPDDEWFQWLRDTGYKSGASAQS